MFAVLVVARAQLRHKRGVTLFLMLLAGLSASASMTLWAAARQTAGSVGHFVAAADVADVTIEVCPPDYDSTAAADPRPCFAYEAERELAVVRSLPHVDQASRFSYRPVVGGLVGDEASGRSFGLVDVGGGVDVPTVLGDPIVVAGRLSESAATDEVMVRESAASSLGIRPGDRVWMRSGEAAAGAPRVVSTVVGVVRTPVDLVPHSLESDTGPVLVAREGWADAHDAELPGFGTLAVWLDDDDVEGFVTRARQSLGPQLSGVEGVLPLGELAVLEQATDFESRAAAVTAAVAALTAFFFVGQAVSRQTRAESTDLATLISMGMTRRQLDVGAAMRWMPVALGGAAVAVAGTAAASLLGPIGVARRGLWDRTLQADWLVLSLGGVGVFLAVLVVAIMRVSRLASDRGPASPARSALIRIGSPGLRVGLGLARRSLGRGALPLFSAVAASGLAIAAVVTAAGGTDSLRRVIAEPARFGAPWDALVEAPTEPAAQAETAALLADIEGVVDAAYVVGTNVGIGADRLVWTQALLPVDGVELTRPVIVSGRAPAADDEIALGDLTRRRAGADVGDTITLVAPGTEEPFRYDVVGTTMVTDGAEPNVGHGTLLTPEGLERVDPSATAFPLLAVRLVDGPGRADAVRQLRQDFPGVQVPFPVPSSLANAKRVSGLPFLLALGGAAVAALTFTHALITSTRRNRRNLAVCRVMGFTRRQTYTAIATQATVLALGACALGLVLGVAGARWGWRVLASSFGVTSGPVVPLAVVAACAAGALLVAVLATGIPVRMANRIRPATALRAE